LPEQSRKQSFRDSYKECISGRHPTFASVQALILKDGYVELTPKHPMFKKRHVIALMPQGREVKLFIKSETEHRRPHVISLHESSGGVVMHGAEVSYYPRDPRIDKIATRDGAALDEYAREDAASMLHFFTQSWRGASRPSQRVLTETSSRGHALIR